MADKYQEYVVGFVFNNTRASVVLIEKKYPVWQVGSLNGPGGKIEEGESPQDAMRREFCEEAGVDVHQEKWELFACLDFPKGRVNFFRLFDTVVFNSAHTRSAEQIKHHRVDRLGELRCISNLYYLIPLAIHADAASSGTRLILPVSLLETDGEVTNG